MPEQRRNGVGPAGFELRVEVHWCHGCEADSTVQIVQLTGDPEPVAVCADCGTGIDLWLVLDGAPERGALSGRRVARRGAA